MSHIVTIKTELRSLQAIEAACQRLGWQLHRGQKSYKWFGEWIGDSTLPAELLTQQQLACLKAMTRDEQARFLTEFMGHCDHAIGVPGCEYEIGILERQDDYGKTKYLLAYDYWASGGLNRHMPTKPEDPNLFAQAYAIEAAKQQAAMEGYCVEEHTQANGTIVLTLGDYR